jgi:hypothetical protein
MRPDLGDGHGPDDFSDELLMLNGHRCLRRQASRYRHSLLRPIITLTAIGLVNSGWRNSPVEDWHARGRISDGQMLRINSHTTWRIRQLLARWLADAALSANEPTSDLDRVPAAEIEHPQCTAFA